MSGTRARARVCVCARFSDRESAVGGEEKQMGERGKSLLSGPVCKHPPVNQRDTVKRTVNSKAIESINSNNRWNGVVMQIQGERERDGNEGGLPSVGRVRSFLRALELSVSQREISRYTRTRTPPVSWKTVVVDRGWMDAAD